MRKLEAIRCRQLLARRHNTMTYNVVAAMLLLTSCAFANPCTSVDGLGQQPVPMGVVGMRANAFSCSKFGRSIDLVVQKNDLTVRLNPDVTFGPNPSCPTEYKFPYHTRFILMFRETVKADFFKSRMSPAEFDEALNSGKWPCDLIPFKKIRFWGKSRKLFIQRVADALRQARRFRFDIRTSFTCDFMNFRFDDPKATFTQPEVMVLLKKQQLADSVLAYINNLAFKYRFCPRR